MEGSELTDINYNLLIDIAFFTCVFGIVLYIWGTRGHSFFRKNGIPHEPIWPFMGNMMPVIMGQKSFTDLITSAYHAFPNHKFVGHYEFKKPRIIIRDLDMIKQISINDFDHFTDHTEFVSEEMDPLFGKNLLALNGRKWDAMRKALNPAFTSAKMKYLYTHIAECAEQISSFLFTELSEGRQVMEMKDFFTRYTNDVIATAAFGLKVDSLANKSNEFYEMAKRATTFTGLEGIKFWIFRSFPLIAKTFNITVAKDEVGKYFRSLIYDSITTREQEGLVRQDMIQLLMQVKQGELTDETIKEKTELDYKLTDDDIMAQPVIFLLAGFDPTSTALSFAAHELAVNPDVQKRLQEEIDEAKSKETKVSYETIQSLKYLDMVVSESLRKWPPAEMVDRICVKPYVLKDDINNISFEMQVNDTIGIPITSIHRDPQYFPDPDKFDPERFSDENRSNIKSYTYIPFGVGPRNCIGSKFAILEIKLVLFHILANLNFEVAKETQVPLQLSKDFAMTAEKGFWLRIARRKT